MSYIGADVNALDSLRGGRRGFIGQIPPEPGSLAPNSVGTAQIQDGAVTSAKLATIGGLVAGTYPNSFFNQNVLTVNNKGQVTVATTQALVPPCNASWFTFSTPGSPSGSGGAVTWGASATGGGANITFAGATNIIVTGVGLDTPRRWLVMANLDVNSNAGVGFHGDLQLSVNGGGFATVNRSIVKYDDAVIPTGGHGSVNLMYVVQAAVGSTYSFQVVLVSDNASALTINGVNSNRFDVQPLF